MAAHGKRTVTRRDTTARTTEPIMSAYHLVLWQTPKPTQEQAYASWLRESLAPVVLKEAGFRAIQFLALQAVQLQPANSQHWRICNLFEEESADLKATLSIFSDLARRQP